jgi:diguanylate cyclase (GGDEF)-like protein
MAAEPEQDKLNDQNELQDAAYQELRGFTRSVAELEWLLLALVLLYTQVPGAKVTNPSTLVFAMVGFAAFVVAFNYLNFYQRESRWKLALESWVMVGFVTAALWHTGLVESPLLNAFLLVIVASALTLGKLMTLLEVVLICCIYFFMGYQTYGDAAFSLRTFSELMAKFSPFLLVAYVTTMLAADIEFSKLLLRHESERDELTGIMNMRGFKKALEQAFRLQRRYGRAFSLLIIDADHFKHINDQFGHEAGNKVIQLIARTIEQCLRNTDVLARFGGDEFMVLLRETEGDPAVTAAERIRTALAHTSVDIRGNQVSTTVSIGIASAPKDGHTTEELVENADRALYRSKQTGRDQVTVHTAAMPDDWLPTARMQGG